MASTFVEEGWPQFFSHCQQERAEQASSNFSAALLLYHLPCLYCNQFLGGANGWDKYAGVAGPRSTTIFRTPSRCVNSGSSSNLPAEWNGVSSIGTSRDTKLNMRVSQQSTMSKLQGELTLKYYPITQYFPFFSFYTCFVLILLLLFLFI